MSFTSDTKKELLALHEDQCCQIALLSAMLAINGYLSLSHDGMKLVFSTTSLPVVRKAIQTLKTLYPVHVDVISKKGIRLQKKSQYIMSVKEKVMVIMRELGLMDDTHGFAQTIDESVIDRDCCKRSFLRGAFLVGGSINHPHSSSYHLEIACPSYAYAESMADLMNTFELKSKPLQKKRGYLVYIKDSEKIADFLRVVGANTALFAYEDERIKRDFVNSITRVMNMEIANQNKTFEAANKQLKSIEIIDKLVDESKLSKSVKEAMFLRKMYPEASLNELSDLSENHFNKRVSRSGLNHRFRSINQLAEEALAAYEK